MYTLAGPFTRLRKTAYREQIGGVGGGIQDGEGVRTMAAEMAAAWLVGE